MNGLYVTLGNDGGIYIGKPNKTSSTTSTVYKEASGVVEPLFQAASDANGTTSTFKLVVVGYNGSILLSNRTNDNPSTWSKVHQASQSLSGVAYGGGLWVAVGNRNLVVTSTNGTTWTERQGAFSGADWTWIEYGNGQFVACGGATAAGRGVGTIMFSTNGINWTRGNSGTTNLLQSIAYSPTLNMFVAVGNNGTIVSVKG
jgi:hypothetical protein